MTVCVYTNLTCWCASYGGSMYSSLLGLCVCSNIPILNRVGAGDITLEGMSTVPGWLACVLICVYAGWLAFALNPVTGHNTLHKLIMNTTM
jgi:hypothetical protein